MSSSSILAVLPRPGLYAGIRHRDIKPRNILVIFDGPCSPILVSLQVSGKDQNCRLTLHARDFTDSRHSTTTGHPVDALRNAPPLTGRDALRNITESTSRDQNITELIRHGSRISESIVW